VVPRGRAAKRGGVAAIRHNLLIDLEELAL
jgi:hypothetical protein